MKIGILLRAVVALGLVSLVGGAPIRPIFPRNETPPPQPAPVDQPASGQPFPVKYPDFAAPVERPPPVPPIEQPIPLLLVEQPPPVQPAPVEQPAPVPPVEQPPIPEPIPPPQDPAAAPAPPATVAEELVTMVYTVTVPASQATPSPARKVFVKTFASDPLATSYPPPQDGPIPIGPYDPAYEAAMKKKEEVIFPDQDGGPRAPLDWTPSSGAVEEGAYKPPPRHYAPRPDLVPHDPNLKPIEYSAYEPPVAYYRPDAVDFEAPAGSAERGWQLQERPGRSIYDEEWIDAENWDSPGLPPGPQNPGDKVWRGGRAGALAESNPMYEALPHPMTGLRADGPHMDSGLSMMQGEPRPGMAYSALPKPQQPVEGEPHEWPPHQRHEGPYYTWTPGGGATPHDTLSKQEQERQQKQQDDRRHYYNQVNGAPSVREQNFQIFGNPGWPASPIHPFEEAIKIFDDPGKPV